jgi:hypothetical protein
VTIVAADAFERGCNVTESRQSAESNLRCQFGATLDFDAGLNSIE